MRLAVPARYSIAVRKRVEAILANGCSCGADVATLTKRLTGGGVVTVHLQCAGCGRSVGGALPRAEFYHWQDYPEWDPALIEAWRAAYEQEWQARRAAWAADDAARDESYEQRRVEYAAWLRSDFAWSVLRGRVLNRARGLCEACLAAPARDVHHETYALGRLPPAFALRAVCRDCHQRLHDGWEG